MESASVAARETGRVLVLDDDAAVGRTVAHIAESIGMTCALAIRHTEFFEILAKWDPTHIVLDLMMPDMDGVEVMAKLASRRCTAAVILVSGIAPQVLEAAQRAARANGLDVVDVLPKPFGRATLKELLERPRKRDLRTGPHAAEARGQLRVGAKDIARAIAEREFALVYQPKIRCYDAALVGFEALVRWRHPVHGTISPEHFIPAAEASGYIAAVTEFVLEQSVEWLSSHPDRRLTLAANVSARCLKDPCFGDRLIELCSRCGVDPVRLVLELTETAATDDEVDVLSLLTRLRLKGFHLSIDDFGTGYSSMAQLARLPFSEIKIDKSFVMSAEQSQRSRSIVASTVDLGHRLDLSVVAEGVESRDVLRYLKKTGCDFAQGYLIARPMGGDSARCWSSAAATLA